MKVSWFFYIWFISQVLLSTYNLGKYEKLTYRSDPYVIFDSSDFKIGDKIYFKIKGYSIYGFIEYAFFDDYNIFSTVSPANLKRQFPKREVFKNDRLSYTDEVRYYTIEKTRDSIIQGVEGNYLIIYPNVHDFYDIENTKEDSNSIIIGVVLAVVAVAVIIGIIVYCYKKKKLAAYNQANSQNYNTNNQVQVQNNNNVNTYNQNYNNGFNSNDNFYNNAQNSNYPNNNVPNSNYPNNNTPNYNYPNNNTPNYNYQNNNTPNYNYQNNNIPNYNYPNNNTPNY